MESKSSFSLILCWYILASFIFLPHGTVSRMLLQEVEGGAQAPANPPLPSGVGQNSEMAEADNGRSESAVPRSRSHTSSSWNGQNSHPTDPRQQVPHTPSAFPSSPPPPPPQNSQSVVQNGNSQSVVTNGDQTVVRNGEKTVVINRNGQSWVYNSPTGESMKYNSPPAPTTESVEYSTPTEYSSAEKPSEACNWNDANCDP